MKTAWSGLIKPNDLSQNIGDLLEESTKASNFVSNLKSGLWKIIRDDGTSIHQKFNSLESQLNELEEIVHNVREMSMSLYNRLSNEYGSALVSKYFQGRRLTREEYYLFSAMGMPLITPKSLGLAYRDEHEFFDLFCYEDERQTCYINPDPPDNEMRVGIGLLPEELDIDGLRPEQHDFFKANLPELYARFKREP